MKKSMKKLTVLCTLLTILVGCSLIMSSCFLECEHKYTLTSTEEATCIENGERIYTCIYCGETDTSTIYAGDEYHKWETVSTDEATCTENGQTISICTVCNKECVQTLLASHKYDSTTRVCDPTCLLDGKEEFTCTVCHETGYISVPALGHKEIDAAAVEPTCQEEGFTEGTKCEHCEFSISGRTPISIVDHRYENGSCIWCEDIQTCKVTYVYNGSTDVEFPEETYNWGDTIVLPNTDELEDEFTVFVGWFTSDNTKYTSLSKVTSDVTLYAKIEEYIPVSDLAGLRSIANAPNKNYKLTKDINANGEIWTPIDDFGGFIDGNGYKIYNIVFSTSSAANFGFARINSGVIKDISIKDFTFNASVDVNTTFYLGVVVGVNKGTISNVNISGGSVMFNASRNQLRGSNSCGFGVIAGINEKEALIEKCDVSVEMTFNVSASNTSNETYSDECFTLYSYLGGIAGVNRSNVTDCQYEGDIVGSFKSTASFYAFGLSGSHSNDNYSFLGGIVGENRTGAIARCYSKANIGITTAATSPHSSARAANHINSGIAVGKSTGEQSSIEYCYATGTLTTNASYSLLIGGFIGFNDASSLVKSCYSTASLTTDGGAYIGGFVGANGGIVQNSYSASEVLGKGKGRTGGFVGSLSPSGSISKSYSTGDVTSAGGEVGRFIGHGEGVVFKCYFMEGTTAMSGGTYLPAVTEYNTVEGIVYTKLWNEDFLINEMYWEDYGWIVILDENPLLSWEIEVSHSFAKTTIEPSCERGGFTIYNCADCSRLFVKDYVEPLGHTLETIDEIPATCGAIGYNILKCTAEGCDHEEKSDIKEKLAHAQEALTITYNVDPTCTAPGKTIYFCSDCKNGDIVVDHKPLGHDGTYSSTIKNASCTEEGIDVYYCSREGCGEYEFTVQCTPHSIVEVPYKSPTCGKHIDEFGNAVYAPEDGHRHGEKCSVCTAVISGCEIIPAHSFVLTETITAADCLSEGEGIYTCSDCEYSENKPISAVGHTDSDLNNICNRCGQFTFTFVPEALFTHITSFEELDAIRNDLNGYYILDNDIDLSGRSWTPIGSETHPFKGILFGAGHTINGFNFNADSADGNQIFGLFAYNDGTIVSVNVNSLNVTVRNSQCVIGGIAAYNTGDIIGCSLTGNSVFKLSLQLNIDNYEHNTVEYNMIAGGIVGINEHLGNIQYCNSLGSVSAVFASQTEVTSSCSLAKILSLIYNTKADSKLDVAFGAIAGKNVGIMDTCSVDERVNIELSFAAKLKYQKGRINSTFNVYAADIVGYNSGTVLSCSGKGSAYSCTEGYNYKNKLDQLFKSKLYEININFINYSESSAYAGLIGGNEGEVIN